MSLSDSRGKAASAPPAISWDIRGVLRWTVPYLRDKGNPSPRLDTELLLGKALRLERIALYTQHDRPLTGAEQKEFGELLRRRVRGEPMAYILGRREFMGHDFLVSPKVLIPRPDTEILVEEAIRYGKQLAASRGEEKLRILDVGTGSGCIAISLALAHPQWEVEAWDLCPDALAVAADNARRLQVQDQISFRQLDALSPETWHNQRPRVDLLLSNPPYVSEQEKGILERGVKDFEPSLALFAPEDGLAFYQGMAQWARSCLQPGGRVFWEIGFAQKEAVTTLLQGHGWQDITVTKDYGAIDRVVSASLGDHG